MTGVGFLPVAMYKNKLYFLFGKERDRPNETARGWADFGGGSEEGETIYQTASREGAEELSGFLGNQKKIRSLLNKKKLVIKTDDKNYNTFIVPIEYDENLPKYFNNQISFINGYVGNYKLNNTTMYEKQEIKWYTLNMLQTHKKKFRPFYQEVVGKILKNKSAIQHLVKGKKTKKQTKTRKINTKTVRYNAGTKGRKITLRIKR
jgi:hypothetical protein